MKTFSYYDIVAWKPCYDPVRYIKSDWSGTAIDILNLCHVPLDERLWVVLRSPVCSNEVQRRFAVACARSVQGHLTDQRSLMAIDAAENSNIDATAVSDAYAAWSECNNPLEKRARRSAYGCLVSPYTASYAARRLACSATEESKMETFQCDLLIGLILAEVKEISDI